MRIYDTCACTDRDLRAPRDFLMEQPVPTSTNEPSPRFWHSAAAHEGKLYIRGGNTPDFESTGRQELASTIEQFDPASNVWCKLKTKGTPHPGLSGVVCVTFEDHLFAYGGFDGEELHNTLSQLCMKTLTWSQLSGSAESAGGPLKKDACGMVHFHGDKLALVGGYAAQPNGPVQPGSTFIPNTRSAKEEGWTNEIHVFSISEGMCYSYLSLECNHWC